MKDLLTGIGICLVIAGIATSSHFLKKWDSQRKIIVQETSIENPKTTVEEDVRPEEKVAKVTSSPDNSNIENCFNQSKRLAAVYRAENPNFIKIESSNHFNQKLQKCLVKFYSRTGLDVYFTEVKDAYENKTLVTCFGNIVEKTCSIPAESTSTGYTSYLGREKGEELIRGYMSN